jgi:hypothetical protein
MIDYGTLVRKLRTVLINGKGVHRQFLLLHVGKRSTRRLISIMCNSSTVEGFSGLVRHSARCRTDPERTVITWLKGRAVLECGHLEFQVGRDARGSLGANHEEKYGDARIAHG